MGEYVKVSGIELKAGTCEDMMYVTRAELLWASKERACEPVPHNATVAELLGAPGTFWRFPWITEDLERHNPEAWGQRSPEVRGPTVVEIPREWIGEHSKCRHYFDAPYQASVAFPCPTALRALDNCAPLELSPSIAEDKGLAPVLPWRQRWFSAEREYTVFECYYCGDPFGLSVSQVSTLREINHARASAMILERIQGDPEREVSS